MSDVTRHFLPNYISQMKRKNCPRESNYWSKSVIRSSKHIRKDPQIAWQTVVSFDTFASNEYISVFRNIYWNSNFSAKNTPHFQVSWLSTYSARVLWLTSKLIFSIDFYQLSRLSFLPFTFNNWNFTSPDIRNGNYLTKWPTNYVDCKNVINTL